MQNSYQQTIATEISCTGIGVHTGETVNLTFKPEQENKGISFVRTDITDKNNIIKADFKYVHKTNLGTNLKNEDGAEIATIEHLMSALWSCNIDNLIVEVDNVEIPIFDGSSEPFIFFINSAGTKKQESKRKFLKIKEKVTVELDNKFCSLEPDDNFSVDFSIEFDNSVIGKQNHSFINNKHDYKAEISRARTFGLEEEVAYLRQNGLALGGSLDNAIVVGKDKILNPDGLRFKNEFARHKILDVIGDLYLCKMPIIGKYIGNKAGHELNNKLLRAIFKNDANYEII
ncbi:MAG: UDP-3-O-acyl-N-acetylglucosamine deacetylase [Alphaproteobacteria bacterium]|nr:UDP-3-O-acyl-N-acetylglucosamine deacetylase [Alphaproteobacteria bacterium]MBT5827615.1 UDP-3-O-acyl-N-acetylglucosamine deacetylase [Alphaproteobacteria bacterium]